MKEPYKYSISRDQYKKIKKMDHLQMDKFIVNICRNIANDMNENEEEIELKKDDNYKCIIEALENTKGIGEKIKTSFLENYNMAVKNFVNSKGEN